MPGRDGEVNGGERQASTADSNRRGLDRLSPQQQADRLVELPISRAVEWLCALEPRRQREVLDRLAPQRRGELLSAMDPDDLAHMLSSLAPAEVEPVLSLLPEAQRGHVELLLAHAPDTAGRIMSPEYLALDPDLTAGDALAQVRQRGAQAETVYTLPVVGAEGRLLGVVSLRQLVLSEPNATVGSLMETDIHKARAEDDQESVARLVQETNVLAVPVVDDGDRLVGIITTDDAMTVLEEEDSEDVALLGAVEPLDISYRAASLRQVARSRGSWLLLLAVAATLTVNVLQAFEDTLADVVILALFIPLLIGTGGNAGAQAATMVVRAMAVGEIGARDVGMIVWRELRTGLLLGLLLGALAFLPVALVFEHRMGLVVSLALVGICTTACVAGSALPLLAHRLGFDPAVVSAPFITTLVDATGLVIYFLIARAVFGL